MFATPALALISSFLIFSILYSHLNISFLFFLTNFAQPFSVPRSHLHALAPAMDTTAGAECCDWDTTFSLSQLVIRTLFLSYLGCFDLNFTICSHGRNCWLSWQEHYLFYFYFPRCAILFSLVCFLCLLTYSSICSHGRHHSRCCLSWQAHYFFVCHFFEDVYLHLYVVFQYTCYYICHIIFSC